MMKLRENHCHEVINYWLYDAIVQKVISYKIEQEFLFEL